MPIAQFLALTLAVAQPAPGLTKTQLAKLAKVGRVVVPSYVPARFRLSKFSAEKGEYDLEYAGPKGAAFMVEMASEGIGDVILDDPSNDAKDTTVKVRSKTFGTRDMEVLVSSRNRQFGVDWVDLGKNAKPKFLCISGAHMSAAEGAKIWAGLRYLK